MQKYFHELTDDEYEALLGKITYGELDKEYPQPLWCSYPQATMGEMGCWSLVLRRIHKVEDCSGCELLKEEEAKDGEI